MWHETCLLGNRNLDRVNGDHALDKIRLDQGAADVALAAGIRTQRAIGEQQHHRAIRREARRSCAMPGQVPEYVLDPGEVGIPLRQRAVFRPCVTLQLAVPPFLDVEGRVCPPVGTICGVASRE